MAARHFKVSGLMAIYKGTNPAWFEQALRSLVEQSVQVDEIVVVADGPCDPAVKVIPQRFKGSNVRIIEMETNQGLGMALALGVQHCNGDWVLRMDDDDISLPDRVSQQVSFLKEHSDIDVCGGNIEERSENMASFVGVRKCPENHKKILAMHKFRNAMNHVTVMARRSAILQAGNYQKGTIGFEDYDLWFRMMSSGSKFGNINSTLVLVRFDDSQIKNRTGWKPAMFEFKMQKRFLKQGHIGFAVYVVNILWRAFPRFLPKRMFRLLMKFTMRSRK